MPFHKLSNGSYTQLHDDACTGTCEQCTWERLMDLEHKTNEEIIKYFEDGIAYRNSKEKSE